MKIPSLYDVLLAEAEALRSALAELIAHSEVKKRFEHAGGGLVVITPRPFHWQPLSPDGRRIQSRLRTSYRRFSGLVRATVVDEPESTLENLEKLEAQFLSAVDQDEPTDREHAHDAGATAAQALGSQIALVEQLPSDDSRAILVPDTNALIFNPALEMWAFEEVPQFRLAITPTVLRELDLLKTWKKPGVREKAERLIRQVREYRRRGRLFDGVPLRNGVSSIFSVATEPAMEASLPWLDPANQDDRLIASAIDVARRYLRAPVALVTRDANVENKADFAGLACLQPPEPPTASRSMRTGKQKD